MGKMKFKTSKSKKPQAAEEVISAGQLYLNKEKGWLNFNQRVLAQAQNPKLPLLERVKFCNIFHSNLDEFFMKRVGGLKQQILAQVSTNSPDGLSTEDQLGSIRSLVTAINREVGELIEEQLIPSLEAERIFLLSWHELSPEEQTWANLFFEEKVFPVLTPMAVDLGHPFPHISNLSTSLAVSLENPSAQEDPLFARIKIPNVFPNWLRLPSPPVAVQGPSTERFISLIEIIKANVQRLFPAMNIVGLMSFRVTRNVDIEASEDEAEDLLELIEEEVKQRRFAAVVRLEHGPKSDPWLLKFLIDELDLGSDDVYPLTHELEFKSLSEISNLPRPTLKDPPWNPIVPPQLMGEESSIFNVIRSNDLLVHHPFDSFHASVERFIGSAASDPMVVAIKMTLYRTTSEGSSILQSLIRAAEDGKQVVVLIELKARFDEEKNIRWAQMLEQAGAHVVYGIIGLKTHAKIALIVRKEKEEFKTYCHLGTGNYHAQTSRLYTDLGLFTSRPKITREVIEIFHYLTGRSLKRDYKTLLLSPINLKDRFLEMIDIEAKNASKGLPAQIIAKCNNLDDWELIQALYRASQAGVSIDLVIRGFCCLRPQVPGLSENIRVRSIVGPFLEHSRIFYFKQGAEHPLAGQFFIGSADWMTRNLKRRVEVVTPILDQAHRLQIWEIFEALLQDQALAWELTAEGDYRRVSKGEANELSSQQILMDKAKARLDAFLS